MRSAYLCEKSGINKATLSSLTAASGERLASSFASMASWSASQMSNAILLTSFCTTDSSPDEEPAPRPHLFLGVRLMSSALPRT